MRYRKLTDVAHEAVAKVIERGDRVIDATAGNGHDTLFLAQQAGESGHVLAIDVQELAIVETRQRLQSEGVSNVTLIQGSHDQLMEYCKRFEINQPKAIMFNLGYLPGGDRDRTTVAETTLRALTQAMEILDKQGLLCVMTYPGHPAGEIEHNAVEQFLQKQDANGWTYEMHLPFSNIPASKGPRLFLVQKNNDSDR